MPRINQLPLEASPSGDDLIPIFEETSNTTKYATINEVVDAGGGGGGGGAVDSVNTETGDVVLDQDDIADGTTYKQYSATEKTKLAGIETAADVTDTANVTAAGALMDSEIDADLKTLDLPASTTISAFGKTLVDDAAASNARTTLGLGNVSDDAQLKIASNLSDVNSAATSFTNIKQAATSSATGVVELATSAEINTGTDTTRAMPIDQFVASNRNVRYILFRVLDPATNVSTGTVVGGDLEIPFTGTITEIGGYADTAGTTGNMVVDVNKNGTTLMTTNKLSFDSTEKTTRTAATAPTLTTTALTAGDIITVDIDSIQTTPAKGMTIRLGIRMT